MDRKEDPPSSRNTEGKVSLELDVQASQVPLELEQLKLQFQYILFNLEYTVGADHIFTTHLNSVSQTIPITLSASLKLDFEDFKGHHSLLSQERIQNLRVIAERLCSTCHFTDCLQMYIEHRKDIVNMVHRRLHDKLNVEKASVFNYWEELNEKIQGWIEVAKICVGTLFVTEKCFYEKVFGGLQGTIEDGFFFIVTEVVGKLFKFLDSLLASRRLPPRLEILLPLYQEFYNLFPDVIEFEGKDLHMAKSLHLYATGIMSRFKQHMIKILLATERHVLRELSMIPTSKGEIHPLTEYVIHYMDLFSTHRKALANLITVSDDHKVNVLNSNPPGEDAKKFAQDTLFLKHHLIRVIDFLLYNLNFKSNFYEEKSLGHLFMMNNVHSVALKIKSSQELEEIFGNQFQRKLKEKVVLSRNDYVKTTWDGICHFLRDEGSKPHSKRNFFPGKSLKNKFKAFNHMFDYVYQAQVEWKVPDQQLRKRLLGCILVMLIPAYNDFLEQLSCSTHKVKHRNRYIKYSDKDLETKVLNLFQCQVLND